MTGNELIRSSLRLIGVLAAGETPSAEDYADGIEAANLMLDAWSAERLTVLAYGVVSIATTGAAAYTVTGKPSRLEWVGIRDANNIDSSLREIDAATYASIEDKASTGDTPDYFWYQNGTITVYPVPPTGQSLRCGAWTPLTAITSGAATMDLMPGYAEALKYGLSVRLAPEYEREPPPSLVQLAREAKARIQRSNSRPVVANTDLTPVGRANILTDE